jgi:membrane-associated HD superfamily phosphohydrolase
MEIFSGFIDLSSVVAVFVPLLLTCVSLWFACKTKWNVLFRDLGVPLGLFFSVLGATGMARITEANAIGPATAIMLLTITYGGLVSALGYFSTFKGPKPSNQNNQETASWKAITFILVPFIVLALWANNGAAGNAAYVNPVALTVLMTTMLAAVFLSDSDYRTEVLCQASLLSAMVSLVLGLVVLYGSFSGEGLNEGMYEGLSIAMNGLYYGLLSYICLYILSYKFGTTEKIDAPLMNWHWMEVTGFLIFMFFAPETVRESLLH